MKIWEDLRKKRKKEGVRVERRERKIFCQKPRERKELKNEIFWGLFQINILWCTITIMPLPQACLIQL
jgi:hypothetical protein